MSSSSSQQQPQQNQHSSSSGGGGGGGGILRITPIYGSQYNIYGESELPSCTFIEFSYCKIIINIGFHPTYWQQQIQYLDNENDENSTNSKTKIQPFPDHDCILLMNSTWQCIGGLPLYYEYMMKKKKNKTQHQKKLNVVSLQQQQQQQQQKGSSMKILSSVFDTTTKNTNNTNTTNDIVSVQGGEGGSGGVVQLQQQLPPIYATYPTIKMGQMTLYDYHSMMAMDGNVQYIPYTLHTIDMICSYIIPIQYHQHIYITPTYINTNITTTTTNGNTDSIPGGSSNNAISSSSSSLSSPQICIMAYRTGHVVGGAYYILQRILDETIIVYTDSTYHISNKEIHLDPCTLLSSTSSSTTTSSTTSIVLPDVYITRPGGPSFLQFRALYTYSIQQQQQLQQSSGNSNNSNNNKMKKLSTTGTTASASATVVQQPLVQQAQRNLIDTIMSVLRRDGNVLLPVDTSGRILEIILLLYKEWEKNKYYTTYHLICYSPMCYNVLEYAKSQLEWMSSYMNHQFADYGKHPFRFNSTGNTSGNRPIIQFITSSQEFHTFMIENETQYNDLPCCIIASGLSMEGGPSRDVLLQFADNPDNAILFTDSSQCYLRSTLYSSSSTTITTTTNTTTTTSTSKTATTINVDTATTVGDRTGEEQQLTLNMNSMNQEIDTLTTTTTTTTETSPLMNSNTIEEDGNNNDEDVTNIGEAMMNESRSIWTTAGQLLQAWVTAKVNGTEMADSVYIDVNVPIRAPLSGNELKLFLEQEEMKRQEYIKAAEKRAMLAQVELAKGQLRLGEDDIVPSTTISSSSSTNTTLTTTNKASTLSTTTATNRGSSRPKKKSRFDSTLFLKFSKPLYMTFDIREEAVGLGQPDSIAKYGIGESVGRSGEILEDDYGISVQPERFIDIISGVDPTKFAGGTGRIGSEDPSRRGFGYDVDKMGNRKSNTSSSSRVVSDIDDHDDEVDALDEQIQEALDLSEGTGIIRGRNGRLPTKVSTVPRKLEVLAEISYIPGLEGRVDARAVRQSIRALQPREVIVLGGTAKQGIPLHDASVNANLVSDEVHLLAEAAKSFVKGDHVVWTPSDGETVELDVGHAAYNVRLVDKPYFSKSSMDVENDDRDIPEIIEPYEMKLGSCNVSLVNCVATGQKVALDGSIVLAPRVPTRFENKVTPPIYLSDGEILLTDLRAELIALGMKAEYSAHTGYTQLVVNGKIVIKKEQNQDGIGRIHIEGPLCEDFFTVRSILSGQYVVL